MTSGVSLVRPPPAATPTAPAVVQGSKSYMEVSMSANRTSSRAKSDRNPEGEEDGEEGEEDPSIRPAGGSTSGASIIRISAQRLSASKAPAASGLAPVGLLSLGRPVGDGGGRAVKWEAWVSGVGAEEVVAVIQLAAAVLVMAVGGPSSMSPRAEEKLLNEVAGGGTLGGRRASGKCGA